MIVVSFVPYDDGVLAWCGAIEPEFVEEIVGWANEEILVNADMIPIASFRPVAWVPGAFTQRDKEPR